MSKASEKFKRWLVGEFDIDSGMETKPAQKPDMSDDKSPAQKGEFTRLRKVEKAEIRSFSKLYTMLSVILCFVIIGTLLLVVSYLPRYGNEYNPGSNEVVERYVERGMEETGAVNIVAGMILDYRAFDTLGESFVLFTAVCAVLVLMQKGAGAKPSEKEIREEALCDSTKDPIIRKVVYFLTPVILMFGVYVLLNGHLSPGGGFSGGSIIGAGLILYSQAYGFARTEKFLNERTIKLIVVIALSFYCIAKGYSFFTGANELDNIIRTGVPGDIFSAGLILPLNVAVGFVVACTMYSFYSLFRRGRV